MQATKSTYLYFLALPISEMGFVSFSAVGLYSYLGKLLIATTSFSLINCLGVLCITLSQSLTRRLRYNLYHGVFPESISDHRSVKPVEDLYKSVISSRSN
jgi:hypothetical protein